MTVEGEVNVEEKGVVKVEEKESKMGDNGGVEVKVEPKESQTGDKGGAEVKVEPKESQMGDKGGAEVKDEQKESQVGDKGGAGFKDEQKESQMGGKGGAEVKVEQKESQMGDKGGAEVKVEEKENKKGDNGGVEVKVEEKETQMGDKGGVEAKVEEKETQVGDNGGAEVKVEDQGKEEPKAMEKYASYREESNFTSDLKEFERKALVELKKKLEEAILGDSIFKKEEVKNIENQGREKEKEVVELIKETKQENKEREEETAPEAGDEKKVEEKKPEAEQEKKVEEKKPEAEEEKKVEETNPEAEEEEKVEERCVDKDISLWGVPLLPSKGAEELDVVLLKFLRAREFKVNDAFEMLKKSLQWRKENSIDSIIEEDVGAHLGSAAYMSGVDREGHPICYNIYGVFNDDELYQKSLATEEKRNEFLRWRLRLMEKGIQKLDLKPGGISSLLQINDLKNSPGPAKKELRIALKQAVGVLQDNYPEFVSKNVS